MSDQSNGTANTNADAAAAAAAAAAAGSQDGQSNGASDAGPLLLADQVFAELGAESREWAVKQGYATEKGLTAKEAAKLVKDAHNAQSLIGNSVRIPGKDATPEERNEFLNKLGRPAAADGYEFTPPKELPEALPYDGERATEFKGVAHAAGLTAEQAKSIHDWFVASTVKEFEAVTGASAEKMAETAQAETEKLVKLWGPLDGPTARANLQLGHKVLVEAGNEKVIEKFKAVGLLAPDGETILSEELAVLFANIGNALYKEDGMLKGDPNRIGNPFSDDKPNMTEQMRLWKQDRGQAISLIQAAGKKPADFGLSA